MQQLDHIIFIGAVCRLFAQCIQHACAELERACGRCDECLCGIAGLLAVVLIYLYSNCRVGIAGVAVLLVQFCDGCLCLSIVAETAVELFGQLCLDSIRYLISSLFCQSREPFPDLCIVFPGQQIQQALQVAGDQDVHRTEMWSDRTDGSGYKRRCG